MGVQPISFTLVDATPYRLIYSVVSGTGPTVLPNAGGGTPDLRTDAESATPGSGRNPMLEVVSTAVVNQVEARKLLLGEQPVPGATTPASARILRARARITNRSENISGSLGNWDVDADEGAAAGSPGSAGFPVFLVDVAPGSDGIVAYLDIFVMHTYDR